MLMSRLPDDSANPEEATTAEGSSSKAKASAGRHLALQQAEAGRSWRIVAIDGDVALQRALARMGLRPGLCIEVAQHTRCGPVVVAGGLKLALGEDAARRLLVEPCEEAAA